MALQRYDPAEVHVIYGAHKIEGYGKDTFVEVSRNSPAFSMEVGAAGHAVAIKSNDRSGYIQVTLLQTSLSNNVLSAFANASDLAAGGIALPILMRDALGTALCSCAAALIEKQADVRCGTSHQERVWRFLCGTLLVNVGGN